MKCLISFFLLLWLLTSNCFAEESFVVAREWRGKTSAEKAGEYWVYLQDGIKKLMSVEGNLGVQVWRRSEQGATEFVVVSYWRSREDIKRYAGEDIEKPHHLPRDSEFLLELPDRVRHYDVLMENTKRAM